ncbi:MAG: VOC family protein [Candidatus Rokuibacteriota bacterium]
MPKTMPEGYHTVTPALTVKNAPEAIEFYKRAFGAQELMRFGGPDGKSIMHAEIQVGDSRIMLGDEQPSMGCLAPASVGGPTSSLYLYVADVDAAFTRAVAAGAKVLMPVTDMFWGDRFGQVEDPSGHRWGLATHVEDPSPQEIERRQREFFASMSKK